MTITVKTIGSLINKWYGVKITKNEAVAIVERCSYYKDEEGNLTADDVSYAIEDIIPEIFY